MERRIRGDIEQLTIIYANFRNFLSALIKQQININSNNDGNNHNNINNNDDDDNSRYNY